MLRSKRTLTALVGSLFAAGAIAVVSPAGGPAESPDAPEA